MATKALTVEDIFHHECKHGDERSQAVVYAMIMAQYFAKYGHGFNDAWGLVNGRAKDIFGERYPEEDAAAILQAVKDHAWDIHKSLCNVLVSSGDLQKSLSTREDH